MACFLIAIIATSVGLLTPLSRQDADQINQEVENLRRNVSVQLIFENNFLICLIMFIPIFGPVFGLYALYNSGVAINAQLIANSIRIPPLLALATEFLLPVIWLEFIAYSIAFAETFWFIRRARQGLIKRETKNAAILIAIAAILLLAGAIIETVLIQALGG